ncbi:MAG: glycerophosphodiester phosphodiesterase family protein [Gemmatimonadota bacterium]|nr:glycerophosphodiester phosphodiesterase family protein [Gemmatimonadota bacterium]MDH3366443.1 glycerophosphodiester phosphodiesterase family protein [Gemmatimonadota bacterium]MDH3476695.1 glycerophosphodiester phosphodiesterase family protein [Gemmatimonadota bacterium]MDH5549885.1 glycerophosphodiester phosphodiesterase family protein [Gemmatimonadota bacterium]
MILLEPTARPVVGHRGAAGDYPENTLLSFDQALKQGADALELDVRLSADGHAVVIHDPTVDRTTDGSGPVRSFTVAQLRALDAGEGQGVPTLEDVLARYPDTPLILEVKEAEVAAVAAAALIRHGAAKRVLVGSFVHAAMRPFRAGFYRSASRRETALSWLASRMRAQVPGLRVHAFTVPERHGALKVVDAAFVATARRRGRPVHVWTVDDADQARRLRGLGVAGIITNRPSSLRTALTG